MRLAVVTSGADPRSASRLRDRLDARSLVLWIALAAFGLAGHPMRAHAQSSDPVAAYAFDEGTGFVLTDQSGNGNNGTIAGAAWTTGRAGAGSALAFNGTSDWVTIPDTPDLDPTGALTIEAWVYPVRTTDWQTVLTKERAAQASAYGLFASTGADPEPSGKAFLASAGNQRVYGSSVLPVNTWSHLALTFDGAALRFYVNGSEVGSRAVTGSIATSGDPLRLGGNSVYGEFFQGRIDDVRIYKRPLSPGEIVTDMNTPVRSGSTSPPPSPPPSGTTRITLDYGSRSALVADGWDFLARTASGSTRNTEQTTGQVVTYASSTIQIPADVGTPWGASNNTRNTLFRNLPSDWQSVRLKVAAFAPVGNYQCVCLMAYQNDDTYAGICRDHAGGQLVEWWHETAGNPVVLGSLGATATSNVTLRLDRDPATQRITAFVSLDDGTSWTALAGSVVKSLASPRLGLFVGGNVSSTVPVASLDFVDIVAGGSTSTPTLAVSPTSLGFSGAQGGSNPASKSLSLSNSGTGTLSWSATTNQPWLSISPPSGTVPATPAVAVSLAGLGAGSYSGTVVITATGASNSPVSMPVTLVVGDSVPPVRSNGAPTGTLPAGTVSTTLSLSTNENAVCKYGTVAGTSYAALPSTFSTTGGVTHSTVVSGLTGGTAYTFRVRCQDLSGNVNTDDVTISFAVAGSTGGTIFDQLGDNAWVRVSTVPTTRFICRQFSFCNETRVLSHPVGRGYSGIAYGNGQLMYFGGGHSSHPGNDVEMYDIASSTWQQHYPPEGVPEVCLSNSNADPACIIIFGGAGSPVPTPSGRPSTQHTFQQIAYDPVGGRFIAGLSSGTWSYRPSTRQWTRLTTSLPPSPNDIRKLMVYDPELQALLWFPVGTSWGNVHRFDFSTNSWSVHHTFPNALLYSHIYSAYDPNRRKHLISAAQYNTPATMWFYDAVARAWSQLSGVPAQVLGVHSFDYDPVNQVFVFVTQGSTGRAEVWTYDQLNRWAIQPTPSTVPTLTDLHGALWSTVRYDPIQQVFFLVNVTETGGAGTGGINEGSIETWAYRYRR